MLVSKNTKSWWTQEQLDFFHQHVDTMPVYVMAELLGKSCSTIYFLGARLKMKRPTTIDYENSHKYILNRMQELIKLCEGNGDNQEKEKAKAELRILSGLK